MTRLLPEKEGRDCRVALFVTPSRLALIKRDAEANGLSRAEYLRRLLNWGWKLSCADLATRELIADLLRDSGRHSQSRDAQQARAEGCQSGGSDSERIARGPSR